MALDEALLRSCGPPTIRLYGWSPPGLSLGYFQESARFTDVPGQHVLVRRLTGGGAIYHDDDLTFSLTADESVVPGSLPDSYALLHDAIGSALADVGVPSRSLGQPGVGRPRPREPWCLADEGPHDLVTDSRKILGSAQRRIRHPRPRILHHGSIMLSAPRATPECGSVALHNSDPDVGSKLAHRIAHHVAEQLQLTLQPGEPTNGEWTLAHELVSHRYANPEFTLRK